MSFKGSVETNYGSCFNDGNYGDEDGNEDAIIHSFWSLIVEYKLDGRYTSSEWFWDPSLHFYMLYMDGCALCAWPQ